MPTAPAEVASQHLARLLGQINEDMLRLTIERMYRERGKLSSVGPLD